MARESWVVAARTNMGRLQITSDGGTRPIVAFVFPLLAFTRFPSRRGDRRVHVRCPRRLALA